MAVRLRRGVRFHSLPTRRNGIIPPYCVQQIVELLQVLSAAISNANGLLMAAVPRGAGAARRARLSSSARR